MTDRMQCRFFVLRYAPDAVKNEFINFGLVLLPPAGSAQVRFTRDWSRVICLDPEADVEMLQALENDLREQIAHNVKRGVLKPTPAGDVKYSWRGMVYLWCQFLLDLVRL